MQVNFQGLRDASRSMKPSGADDEWLAAHLYYTDQGLEPTRQLLQRMQLGIPHDSRPLDVNLMRRVVDRLAVTYDSPPSRWLLDASGSRMPEESPEHEAMVDALRRAQYDLAWRLVDRQRALMRQAVLRLYPSDHRGAVVCRVFEPFNVLRSPDPSEPDSMDADQSFALCLRAAGNESDERWEYWQRDGAMWRSWHTDGMGHVVAEPFGAEGLVPYEHLPVQQVYDDYPGGRAWLPPRSSRTRWTEAINAAANDLRFLIVMEAHSRLVVATKHPEDVPQDTGPGKVWAIPDGAIASILTTNPKIKESLDVIQAFVRLWTFGEDLPTSEFSADNTIETGAALRVQQRPLLARRDAQVPLAEEDERQAWRRLVSVHNIHAPTWGAAPLPELDIEVELASRADTVDPREMLEASAKAMALGAESVIDLIQRLHSADRSRALEIYERIAEDRALYPPPSSPAAQQSGPRAAGVSMDDGRSGAQMPSEAPSELDVESVTAAAAGDADG